MSYYAKVETMTFTIKKRRNIHFYMISLLLGLFFVVLARTLLFMEYPQPEILIQSGIYPYFLQDHYLYTFIDSVIYILLFISIVLLTVYALFLLRRGELNSDFGLFIPPILSLVALCTISSLLVFIPSLTTISEYSVWEPALVNPIISVPMLFWTLPHITYPFYDYNQLGLPGILLILNDISALLFVCTLVYSFYRLGMSVNARQLESKKK